MSVFRISVFTGITVITAAMGFLVLQLWMCFCFTLHLILCGKVSHFKYQLSRLHFLGLNYNHLCYQANNTVIPSNPPLKGDQDPWCTTWNDSRVFALQQRGLQFEPWQGPNQFHSKMGPVVQL